MTDYDAIDFFRGDELVADPYPYFDWLRAQCPVQRERHHDVMMVTGYDEAITVYNDTATFSSCNSPTGPFPGFPVALEGDDVNALIEQHRDGLPMSDQLLTFDPPVHTAHRALLMRLITPKRLRENEEFMWKLADRQIDEFIGRGDGEFIRGYGQPFAMLAVADLLGVPESDHELFRKRLGAGHSEQTGAIGSTGDQALAQNPLAFLYEQFTAYVEQRRHDPRDDVMTGMANATFPDGSIPEAIDVARIAANLFAAGQETTVRLFGTALQRIGDNDELQQLLRDRRELIPNFVEECLRIESPVKGDFRLARVTTELGGVKIPAGTTVMVVNGAANHDPGRFECPAEFRVERANARHHIAFGHGAHTCPGAPLARAEGRITIERLLDRMDDIRISEQQHGPAGARRYDYVPTYILRGVSRLYIDFAREELTMAIDRQESPYRRGNRYEQMPIPMVAEHCVTVDAGAVQLVVESRQLTNAILDATYNGAVETAIGFDDFGATLHVCGTADGLEHLRFDCFENEPHYHYIEQRAGANTVVRIDELAVGDPVEFSLACVEHHLPDMLRNCGVAHLADDVAGRLDRVQAAVAEVRELMTKARAH